MSDEELERKIAELAEKIKAYNARGKAMTGAESKDRALCLTKKTILQKVKVARQTDHKGDETHNLMMYGMLESWLGKYPYLAAIVSANFRWHI